MEDKLISVLMDCQKEKKDLNKENKKSIRIKETLFHLKLISLMIFVIFFPMFFLYMVGFSSLYFLDYLIIYLIFGLIEIFPLSMIIKNEEYKLSLQYYNCLKNEEKLYYKHQHEIEKILKENNL